MNEDWPLWAFSDGWVIIVTRGRTIAEASWWINRKRNYRLAPIYALPIESAARYTINHPFDWLHTPPSLVQGEASCGAEWTSSSFLSCTGLVTTT